MCLFLVPLLPNQILLPVIEHFVNSREIKSFLACLIASVAAAVVIGLYSVTEAKAITTETFGVMFIAFLFAFALAVIVGLPFHYIAQRWRKENALNYSMAGLFAGIAIPIVPLVASRAFDSSLLKTMLVLALAGFIGGRTFFKAHRRLKGNPELPFSTNKTL